MSGYFALFKIIYDALAKDEVEVLRNKILACIDEDMRAYDEALPFADSDIFCEYIAKRLGELDDEYADVSLYEAYR